MNFHGVICFFFGLNGFERICLKISNSYKKKLSIWIFELKVTNLQQDAKMKDLVKQKWFITNMTALFVWLFFSCCDKISCFSGESLCDFAVKLRTEYSVQSALFCCVQFGRGTMNSQLFIFNSQWKLVRFLNFSTYRSYREYCRLILIGC